jgi:hypothetical protein
LFPSAAEIFRVVFQTLSCVNATLQVPVSRFRGCVIMVVKSDAGCGENGLLLVKMTERVVFANDMLVFR